MTKHLYLNHYGRLGYNLDWCFLPNPFIQCQPHPHQRKSNQQPHGHFSTPKLFIIHWCLEERTFIFMVRRGISIFVSWHVLVPSKYRLLRGINKWYIRNQHFIIICRLMCFLFVHIENSGTIIGLGIGRLSHMSSCCRNMWRHQTMRLSPYRKIVAYLLSSIFIIIQFFIWIMSNYQCLIYLWITIFVL